MLSYSMSDVLHAVVLLIFLEGFFYTFFPKSVQGFAMRCLVDANPANLRLFGLVLFGLGFFLTVLLDGTP